MIPESPDHARDLADDNLARDREALRWAVVMGPPRAKRPHFQAASAHPRANPRPNPSRERAGQPNPRSGR